MAGLGDKLAGKAKEIKGKLTGDESSEARGEAQFQRGELKGKGEKAKDSVQGTTREMRGELTGDDADKWAGRAQREG
jgi:uncharacterized protein YjbJ (UPF0337 family)